MTDTTAQPLLRTTFAPSRPYALLIGGEEVATERTFDAVDPSTGAVWTTIPQAEAHHVAAAVQAARRAFPAWRASTPAQRQEALWRMADAGEADPERGARPPATENGPPPPGGPIAGRPARPR